MLVEAPDRLPPVRLQGIEGTGQHQVLHLRFGQAVAGLRRQPDAAAEFLERPDRTLELGLLEDLERLVAHAMHVVEAEPQRTAFDGTAHVALVDVDRQDLDAVVLGILHEHVRVIETHRLVVEQPGVERRRVVQLEPGRLVAGAGEGGRVRLGEAELGERR